MKVSFICLEFVFINLEDCRHLVAQWRYCQAGWQLFCWPLSPVNVNKNIGKDVWPSESDDNRVIWWWHDDMMSWWQDDRMAGWQEASQTIDHMVYLSEYLLETKVRKKLAPAARSSTTTTSPALEIISTAWLKWTRNPESFSLSFSWQLMLSTGGIIYINFRQLKK